MKFSTVIFLASTVMVSLQSAQTAQQLIPHGNSSWTNCFEFKVDFKNVATNQILPDIPFKCSDKTPIDFDLTTGGNIPTLDLKNQSSCNTFYNTIQNYIAGLKVINRKYTYEADIGNKHLSCPKIPPNQDPLGCVLDTINLQENYGLKGLEVSLVLIKMGEENDAVVLDVTSTMKDRFGIIAFGPPKSEGQANLDRIVSTRKDFQGCVFDAVGSVDTFTIPKIPGIPGFEAPEAPREKRCVSYSQGPTFYEDALASQIIAPQSVASQSEEWNITITDTQDDNGFFSEDSSDASASGQQDSPEEETVFDLNKYFKLIGHERRAVSPYVYFDGKSWYLTQSFEQDCVFLVNGEPDLKEKPHTLRHTRKTPYPVQVNGFATTMPKGLYQLEKGSWSRVNNFYKPQDMSFPAKGVGSHGFLTTTVKAQPQTCDLKSTLENLGSADGYVELMGSKKFQELLTQLQRSTSGLLRTITALPAHEQHIIVPLLLKVRDFPHLKDDELMHSGSTGAWFKTPTTAWGYNDHEQHYSELRDKLGIPDFLYKVLKTRNMQTFYIQTPGSLKLLPLIPGFDASGNMKDKIQIVVNDYDGQTEKYRPFEGGSAPIYQALANYLSMDQVVKFIYSPSYGHESDTEPTTIQPMSEAIKHLNKLKTFVIPRYMGIKNFEYLIRHGLAFNHSIIDLEFGQIYGEYPVALMGQLLSKNTTLKKIYISMENVADLECLNELGRGLKKNQTLEELTIKIKADNERSDYINYRPDWLLNRGECNARATPTRPLPGRPKGSRTTDFSAFREGLMGSKLKRIAISCYKKDQNPYVDCFVNMINGINKDGLKIDIY